LFAAGVLASRIKKGWTRIDDTEELLQLRQGTTEDTGEVLQQGLHGDGEEESGGQEVLYSQSHSSLEETRVRAVRGGEETLRSSSQGQELEEQRTVEHSDLVRQMSRLIASCRRGDCSTLHDEALQIVRTPEFAEYVQRLPVPHSETWRSLPEEELQKVLAESIAAVTIIPNRVDRLRLCGNGVVPDCAALAFRTLRGRLMA